MSSNSRRRLVLRPRTAYIGLTSLVGAFALPTIFIAKRLVDRHARSCARDRSHRPAGGGDGVDAGASAGLIGRLLKHMIPVLTTFQLRP